MTSAAGDASGVTATTTCRDNDRDVPMVRILARLALVVATLVFVVVDTSAHDSWISRGGQRNAAGEWCCGEGDCFVTRRRILALQAS